MDTKILRSHNRAGTGAHVLGTLLLLGGTLFGMKVIAYRQTEVLAQPLGTLSRNVAGFTNQSDDVLSEGVIRQLKPTSYVQRTYLRNGVSANLFIAYYAQQRAGESMHSPKHCLPGSGWEIWDYATTNIESRGQTYTINKYSISKDGDRRVVLYWYQSKQRIIASEYMGKVLLARDALLRNSTAGAIVRIIVPDQPSAIEMARQFASAIIPELQRCFGS